MATFDDTLFTYLSGHAGLSALVGDKIYPDQVPQKVEAPYVCFYEIYREKIYSHQGYSNSGIYSIQITCSASTKIEARAIADQIAAAMEAWTAASDQIGHVFQEGENAGWEDSRGLYYIDLDFDVFYVDN